MLRWAICREAPTRGVHTGEDVILTAMGTGSEPVAGFLDNTALFRIMVDALGPGAETAR